MNFQTFIGTLPTVNEYLESYRGYVDGQVAPFGLTAIYGETLISICPLYYDPTGYDVALFDVHDAYHPKRVAREVYSDAPKNIEGILSCIQDIVQKYDVEHYGYHSVLIAEKGYPDCKDSSLMAFLPKDCVLTKQLNDEEITPTWFDNIAPMLTYAVGVSYYRSMYELTSNVLYAFGKDTSFESVEDAFASLYDEQYRFDTEKELRELLKKDVSELPMSFDGSKRITQVDIYKALASLLSYDKFFSYITPNLWQQRLNKGEHLENDYKNLTQFEVRKSLVEQAKDAAEKFKTDTDEEETTHNTGIVR